jgi:hypothetical protein
MVSKVSEYPALGAVHLPASSQLAREFSNVFADDWVA